MGSRPFGFEKTQEYTQTKMERSHGSVTEVETDDRVKRLEEIVAGQQKVLNELSGVVKGLTLEVEYLKRLESALLPPMA